MPRARSEPQRGALRDRLEARRAEIEEAAISRVYAVAGPSEEADPAYIAGIRSAVSAGIDYAFAAIERVGQEPPSPPAALLVQARLAARGGVTLEEMVRRYIAGYTLFGSILFEEAEPAGVSLSGETLKRLSRLYTTYFDRLLGAVTEEYRREAEEQVGSSERGPARLVRRLLAGELADPSPLGYDLNATHIGIVASGAEARPLLRELAASLDRRLLVVEIDEHTTWAWLGSRRESNSEELDAIAEQRLPQGLAMAVGEPASEISGWRLTHRQAATALPVALRGQGVARYGDIPLLAAALRDDLLATSLRRLYLQPLERERDGGKTARNTLRAYFGAARNLSSAAAALGVNRRTVSSRLAAIEERLGRRVDGASAEIETALRLEEIEAT
jgi:hypothetical protein